MCTSPREATFNIHGQITFNKLAQNYDKSQKPFKVPCGKCVECLLERSREWSIRCVHEAKVNEQNCFITLTYSDQNLPKDKELHHRDFQLFMKRLRKKAGKDIGFFMCGEYGDTTQRPHYHALIFGWRPKDLHPWSTNKHGDQLWTSKELDDIWGLNDHELCPNKIGDITQKSAAYVARYVLKKQNKDAKQGYQRSSKKYAIGKRWLEKYWRDIFINGKGTIVLLDGTKSKIPRYYEKWLEENHPNDYVTYIETVKAENTARLEKKAEEEHAIYLEEKRKSTGDSWHYKSPLARKREILKERKKQLKRSYL